MATIPMEPIDAAWYHMDGSVNLAMVTGVALTSEPLDFEKVREVYRHRLAEFDRFRQRVVETGFPVATPHWQDMPHFDIEQHVHHVALPAPHDLAALKAMFTDIASAPLDRDQPLWQVHVIDNVAGGSALVMRYHHCIGDGSAIQAVVQKLFDTRPDVPLEGPANAPATGASRSRRQGLVQGFDAVERAARRAIALARGAVGVVAHPRQTLVEVGKVIGGAGALLTEMLGLPDPKSPFKGDFGMRQHVAWSEPVAVSDVKAIGAPTQAKVNDVLIAAMTGALRAYLARRGVNVDRSAIRAMVPVDLRPPERFGRLGNEFGLVLLDLPISCKDASERLARTKARMDKLKRSPEPFAMRILLELMGRAPKAIEDIASFVFGSKASVVMTNVVGPKEPVYLAGVPIDRMMFWVPHPGREMGVGISILSYRGMASLAVISDAGLVPDPETITDEFNREFDRMRRASLGKSAPSRKRAASTHPAGGATRPRSPASSPHEPASAAAGRRPRAAASKGA